MIEWIAASWQNAAAFVVICAFVGFMAGAWYEIQRQLDQRRQLERMARNAQDQEGGRRG